MKIGFLSILIVFVLFVAGCNQSTSSSAANSSNVGNSTPASHNNVVSSNNNSNNSSNNNSNTNSNNNSNTNPVADNNSTPASDNTQHINDPKNPPSASMIFTFRDGLVGEPLMAVFYASEDLKGLVESDFTITGASLKSWEKVTPKLYRVVVLPSSTTKKVIIRVDKNAAVDADGNSLKDDVEAVASVALAPWAKSIRRYRGIIDANLEYQNSNAKVASIDMIWIRPGSFVMGCSKADDKHCKNNETTHKVTLSDGFWISRSEITQKQWFIAMGTNPSYFNVTSLDEQEKLPVENISYDDALSFTEKVSTTKNLKMTLPTEAQWEYAARATTTTAYYDNYDDIKGDANSESAHFIGWYAGNSSEWTYKKKTQPIPSNSVDLSTKYQNFYKKSSTSFATHYIMQKANSDWRLKDTSGNVAEWCFDWYQDDLGTADSVDPKGSSSGTKRVVKGGSWYDGAAMLRSSSREGIAPSIKSNRVGLRVVILPKDI
jgi:formylglycine-generating enzyme required for sulfatase activity